MPDALRGDGAATSAAQGALVAIAAAIVAQQVAGPVAGAVLFGLQRRFHAYLSQRLMSAVTALPGLAYHEDPRFRDKLHVSEWIGWAPVNSVQFLRQMVQMSIQLTGMAVVAVSFAWWAPAIVVVAAIPEGVSSWKAVAAVGWARRVRSEDSRRADYYKKLALTIEPAKELRVFRLGDWVLGRQGLHWMDGMREAWALRRRNLVVRFGLHLFAVGALAYAYMGALFAALSGRIDIGVFTATTMALTAMLSAIISVFASAAQLRQANFYLPTALQLLDLPRGDLRLDVSGSRPARSTARSGIRFEGVSFAYPQTDRVILDGLDLEIASGGSIALVGENGAGKTTLIKLLCRFYDPTAGRITLDGADIRELDLADLRRRLAVIFQDFVHYHLPARDNVGFGAVERLSEPDLTRVAAGRVGVLDVIEALPDGWDTPLAREFGGTDLSGGEWQRIGLARAIMAQLGGGADLLILDEPTASLDVRMEHELYERFADLARDRTTVLVSHRFSTVRMAERIVLIDGGRVVEDGPHGVLLARGGRYAELYEMQASHYRLTGSLE
jgi:ATP-binding cassette subfamily B protein